MAIKHQKIIILGHTGFLGRCLYDNFSKNQQFRVCGFSSAQIDLSSQEAVVKLRRIADDAVVIMTASAMVKVKDFVTFNQDVSMFRNLANHDLISKVKHLVYISGLAIYGHYSDLVITESSRPNPDDLYSLAKFFGELTLKQACDYFKIPLTIIRPGIIYGQGDTRSPLFRFVNDARLKKEIEMFGDGSTRLFWVHKSDLWRAVNSVIEDFKLGDYNIVSDDEGISLCNLADIVFNTCRLKTGVKFVSSSKVSPNIRFSTSKFRADFPGFIFIQLEEGIKDYFDYGDDMKLDQL